MIHLQGVSADTSGRNILIKALNESAEKEDDSTWKYKKAAGGTYECTLGSKNEWKNIGTAKQMWAKIALSCTTAQQDKIRKHMDRAETIALTIPV